MNCPIYIQRERDRETQRERDRERDRERERQRERNRETQRERDRERERERNNFPFYWIRAVSNFYSRIFKLNKIQWNVI